MDTSLARILVKAKQLNKWVPVKYLNKHDIQRINLMQLEDEGLVLTTHHKDAGILLKLTLKGYHHFKNL
ncbi:hypothetical protein [Gracilibacillus xinjiangensis]|uniref:Antirepressor protein C-terminal domain-containing protein n=1 Tax=Gracilibacillus xinjiangensis TaxID=1193282 RepID=A0ABV8WTU3_9BACI